jgi:hypothetical protein
LAFVAAFIEVFGALEQQPASTFEHVLVKLILGLAV